MTDDSGECLMCDSRDTHVYDFYPNSSESEKGRVPLCTDCYDRIHEGDYPEQVSQQTIHQPEGDIDD